MFCWYGREYVIFAVFDTCVCIYFAPESSGIVTGLQKSQFQQANALRLNGRVSREYTNMRSTGGSSFEGCVEAHHLFAHIIVSCPFCILRQLWLVAQRQLRCCLGIHDLSHPLAWNRVGGMHENAVHPRMAGFQSLCTIITEEPHFSDVVRNMGNHTMQVPTAPPIPFQVTWNCSKNATPSFSAATALSSHNTCTSDQECSTPPLSADTVLAMGLPTEETKHELQKLKIEARKSERKSRRNPEKKIKA